MYNAFQRTERYRLRSIAMIGGAHMLESITAPSASDDHSDSSNNGSSSSSESEEEDETESKETADVSNKFVTKLSQNRYNAFPFQSNNNVVVVKTSLDAEAVVEMVVDGVSGTATGSTASGGSGDGEEVDSEAERAVTVGEEDSEDEVRFHLNAHTMHFN